MIDPSAHDLRRQLRWFTSGEETSLGDLTAEHREQPGFGRPKEVPHSAAIASELTRVRHRLARKRAGLAGLRSFG